jgi:hypothetical protein
VHYYKENKMVEGKEICTCDCHKEGISIMHCFPCCDYTYVKYIKEDGTIDFTKYNKLKGNSTRMN